MEAQEAFEDWLEQSEENEHHEDHDPDNELTALETKAEMLYTYQSYQW